MTEPEQFWWEWRLVRIIVPILLIVLWIMLHLGLEWLRREWFKRATMVQDDRASMIAPGNQRGRAAADKPRNRRKRVSNNRRKSDADRRPA